MNIPLKLTIIIIFILSLAMINTPVKSQSTANIIIGSDGSVTGTAAIVQSGNTYTLTANLTGKITVQKSNIVIDGAGYAINGEGINFPTSSVREQLIYNVTIRNLIISTGRVFANGGGYHTFYNDYIHGIELWGTEHDNITLCTVANINFNYGGSHSTITQNNIVNGLSVFLGSNVTVDRNYWRLYLTRYPNATEIGNTGIGNQPYVIDLSTPVIGPDYHPLMKPISIPLTGSIIDFPTLAHTPGVDTDPPSLGTPIPPRTPSPAPTPTDMLNPTPSIPEIPLVAVLAIVIALSASAVLIARRRRT